MNTLTGKTAIVTGASAGIGRRIAEALGAAGANLVLAARSATVLDSLAAELSQSGIQAVAVPTDVTDIEMLEHLVDRSLAEFGTIDILINNAGIESFSRYHDQPLNEIERTIEVNLTAALRLTRLVVPAMLTERRGHVVNIASVAGKHGPAFGAAYGASKAGMIAFTQSFRAEYRRKGIGASVICPGFTDGGGIYESMKRRSGRRAPWTVGRTSAPAVADAVVKAILHDLPETIVNRPPVRPWMVVAEAFPSLGEWLVRKASFPFLRKLADAPESDSTASGNSVTTDNVHLAAK